MTVNFLIPIAILAIAFIIKMPIAYGMLLGAFVYFMATGQNTGALMHLIANGMMNNYVLLSVPLFIFTANVMNSGAVTDRIFKFANGLCGRYRGGTGYVNVIASLIFSGMTGSAIADASGLGIMEIEQMKKEGYDDGFSCAITAASAVIGPIFPPSIPFVIYATLSGASIGTLFMAGIVPALFIALALVLYIAYIAHKRDYPRGMQTTLREFVRDSLRAIPALLTPVILLAGIYTGVMTPTEAAGIAALYALFISILIYRSLDLKELIIILKDTVRTTASVGMIVAAAYGFSYIVANEHVSDVVADLVLDLTDNKYVFLLIINIVFLLLGMLLDTSVIQLVFVPIVLPMVNALGINLVHFGLLISLNMMIGLLTPPFGMLLFITSGISKTPLKPIIKETIPLIGVEILVLLIITYIPETVLFLPRLLGAAV